VTVRVFAILIVVTAAKHLLGCVAVESTDPLEVARITKAARRRL